MAAHRVPSEAQRLLISATAGLFSGILAGVWAPIQLAALVGWIITATMLVAWIWLGIAHRDPAETMALAMREDDSRPATRVMLVTASVVSLIGVLLAFVKAKHSSGALAPLLNIAGLATVAASWVLVHTLFTLRYARLYYGDPPGGIDFKSADRDPDFRDFAYVAFTVGMTFQVSDTDIEAAGIRRTVLRQALLSYLFGAVIVASTINIMAGLLH